MEQKKKNWMYASFGAIILSVISIFLPVIRYTSYKTGITSSYNVISFLNNRDMINTIFTEYTGNVVMKSSTAAFLIVLICLIGVSAIICAFIGIKSMTKQYESVWPFRLAIAGLIGTAIPSLVLLILFISSISEFAGRMSLGTYIIITPIAMVVACINVTNKHRLTQEELALQREASKYIRPAGDL